MVLLLPSLSHGLLTAKNILGSSGICFGCNDHVITLTYLDAGREIYCSLGGDHTIVLPILRSLYKIYGPISVIHFDAHLDTWPTYPGVSTEQSRVTHGTFFYLAQEEGLLSNTSIHAGIRCKLAVSAFLYNIWRLISVCCSYSTGHGRYRQ